MTFNPLALLLTVVGGLIVAALLGWIRRPRLVTLVPRTFLYSQITDRGQLVEVTVFNRSFKTEESIDVTLNPALRYEMLGSNSQDASIFKNRLQITRIGPSDEVTVLLIVEDGSFKADDIIQTLSKETKGKTVSKLEAVPPTGPQRVSLVAGLIVVPALLYAATLGVDYLLEQPGASKTVETSKSRSIELQGWKVPRIYKQTSASLYQSLETGKLVATLGSPSRRGDVVTVPIKVQNSTNSIVKATLAMTSARSENRIPSYERRLSDIIIVPGKAEERSIKVVIPEKGGEPSDQIVFIELFFDTTEGDSLQLSKEHSFRP